MNARYRRHSLSGCWRGHQLGPGASLSSGPLLKHGSLIVVFPPGVDHWSGVTLVMQPPLQAHMSIAGLLSAVAALALVALFAHWLTPADNAGRREQA